MVDNGAATGLLLNFTTLPGNTVAATLQSNSAATLQSNTTAILQSNTAVTLQSNTAATLHSNITAKKWTLINFVLILLLLIGGRGGW